MVYETALLTDSTHHCPGTNVFSLARGHYCCANPVRTPQTATAGEEYLEYGDGPATCDPAEAVVCPSLPEDSCQEVNQGKNSGMEKGKIPRT